MSFLLKSFCAFCVYKNDPRIVVGYVAGVFRAHLLMKWEFILGCCTDATVGGVRIFQRICAKSSNRCTGIKRQMLASMSSIAKGFAKKPSAPAFKQAVRTSEVLFELIIRTFDCERCPLMNSSNRMPVAGVSRSGGICKSSMEMSGL